MKLYFGNRITIETTFLLLGLIAFIVYNYLKRDNINSWGRRTLFLVAYGLFICCVATVRDGLDKTIQHAIDGSCAPGIFKLVSFPTIVGCIGATIIIIAGLVTIFAHSQHLREMMFFTMSGGIALKVLIVEIARILL